MPGHPGFVNGGWCAAAAEPGLPLSPMRSASFRPDAWRGDRPAHAPGQIDYRLIRRHAVDEFKRGRLSRLEVCDAQPELLRAAVNCGRPTAERCPICDDEQLRLVSFVFGPRLPAHGRCITTAKELDRLGRRVDTFACYMVEVCPGCRWNHLVRSFPIGGRTARV